MVAKTKKERDENLDALAAAAEQWLDQEVARVENETKFLRTVLIARNAENAAVVNLRSAAVAVVDEINNYLFVSKSTST